METVYLYLDVLFLYNFIVNLLLLYLVSYTCSYRFSIVRGVFAGMVGSAYFCVLCVWHYSILEHLCFQMLVSCFMIFTGFRVRLFREFVKLFLVYYLMSFLLAGGIRFSANLFGKRETSIPLFAVGAGAVLVFFLGQTYFRTLKRKAVHEEKLFSMIYNGKKVCFRGFSDTGNTLTEPIEHLSVIVVKQEKLKEIVDFSHPETLRNLRLIPCRTVNQEGILIGFKPDLLTCDEKKVRAVIAVSDTLQQSDCDAIFHPSLLLS